MLTTEYSAKHLYSYQVCLKPKVRKRGNERTGLTECNESVSQFICSELQQTLDRTPRDDATLLTGAYN